MSGCRDSSLGLIGLCLSDHGRASLKANGASPSSSDSTAAFKTKRILFLPAEVQPTVSLRLEGSHVGVASSSPRHEVALADCGLLLWHLLLLHHHLLLMGHDLLRLLLKVLRLTLHVLRRKLLRHRLSWHLLHGLRLLLLRHLLLLLLGELWRSLVSAVLSHGRRRRRL